MERRNNLIKSIIPRSKKGYQFVLYSDSCSGVKGTVEEKAFKKMNRIIKELDHIPQFIIFPGDEIIGLTPNEAELINQWEYWTNIEMAWFHDNNIPIYNTTGNHTAYDKVSERVFKKCNSHLPENGPKNQKRLSYYIVKDELIIIFINTMCHDLGGEGHIELEWLEKVLSEHNNIKYKFVVGHHPIHPVGTMISDYELNIHNQNGINVWNIFKKHKVFAYLCSHILDYDIQIHDGILQILSGGAGRTRRYLHLIQAAIDDIGLRYQVLNAKKKQDHWFEWPLKLPDSKDWILLNNFENDAPLITKQKKNQKDVIIWDIKAKINNSLYSTMQTLISGWNSEDELFTFWIGIIGPEQQLTVQIRSDNNRSPIFWHGPKIEPKRNIELQIAMHSGMGPGGILWRNNEKEGWTSFRTANNWGVEKVDWPKKWTVGYDKYNIKAFPFKMGTLEVKYYLKAVNPE